MAASFRLHLGLLLVATVLATEAQAQQAVVLDEITVNNTKGSVEAGLKKSVVAKDSTTGTKTSTPLLETPQSISVVTPKQWVEQGATSVSEALRYTSGVSANPNSTDTRLDTPLIRGFLAPVYLDGMLLPIGASQFARSRIEPFGLQEIDVLKGAAASALYGQNPPGGLINLVSLRPTETPTHTLEGRLNSFGNWEGAFDVGGPLDPQGHYLYRVTGVYHDGGTQVDYVNDQRVYIAPAFTFAPDAATNLTILTQYQRDKTGLPISFLPAIGTLYPAPNGQIPLNRNIGEPGHDFFSRDQFLAGYLFTHHFDDTATVRQNLRYGSIRTNTQAVEGAGLQSDLETLNRANYSLPENATAFTMDNQVEKKVDTGPFHHTLLAGLDYRYATSAFKFGLSAAPGLNVFDPVYGAALTTPSTLSYTGQHQSQTGIYAQDQVKFGGFGLTVSGRHDWVDTSTLNYLAGTSKPQDDQAFSGRAALNYLFDSGVSPYVAYARSFQPTLGTSVDGSPLKPTSGDEYEAGIKYKPTGIDALLTAAVFDTTQENYVSPDPVNVGFSVQTGKVHIRGAEFEAKASLAEGLDVVASYSHLEGRIEGTDSALDGNSIITTPYNQAAAYVDYTFHSTLLKGFGLGAGVRYTGESYGDLANTLKIPGYTLFDAGAHYDFAALDPRFAGARLAVNVQNIANTYYVSSCVSTVQCYLGNARVVTATIRYSW